MKDYCMGCGQELPEMTLASYFSAIFVKRPKIVRIDGNPYCENCAKIIVDKRRKEIK